MSPDIAESFLTAEARALTSAEASEALEINPIGIYASIPITWSTLELLIEGGKMFSLRVRIGPD